MYEMASTLNKVFIMKRLYNLKMKEGGIVSNHLNNFNTLVSQLISMGINLDSEMKTILLLCSLPKSWEGVLMATNTSVAAKRKLNFDDVAGTLLGKDMRRKNQESPSSDSLIMVSRGRPQDRGKDNNKRRSKSAKRLKSRGKNMVIVCFVVKLATPRRIVSLKRRCKKRLRTTKLIRSMIQRKVF